MERPCWDAEQRDEEKETEIGQNPFVFVPGVPISCRIPPPVGREAPRVCIRWPPFASVTPERRRPAGLLQPLWPSPGRKFARGNHLYFRSENVVSTLPVGTLCGLSAGKAISPPSISRVVVREGKPSAWSRLCGTVSFFFLLSC